MADAVARDAGEGGSPPGLTSGLLHSTGASLHTPESFGRAVISAALTAMAREDGSLDERTLPASFSVRTLRTQTDAPPACIDVCVGILGAEVCIHVVIPETITDIIF
jgi:hypothetical protein